MMPVYRGQEVDEINLLESSSYAGLNDLIAKHCEGFDIIDIKHFPVAPDDPIRRAQVVLKKLPERQQLNEG